MTKENECVSECDQRFIYKMCREIFFIYLLHACATSVYSYNMHTHMAINV